MLCYLHTEQEKEEEDLDKGMGDLEGDSPEQIDRNMWLPEEDQNETEVHYGRIITRSDSYVIVAPEIRGDTWWQCRVRRSQNCCAGRYVRIYVLPTPVILLTSI